MILPYRISRYLFKELLVPSSMGLFLYTFVMLMNHLFVVAEKALSKSLGWELTAQLFLVAFPRMLVLTIPMSVLLGVLIAVGRISADHEWVALQSAGEGPLRMVKPIACFGLLAAFVSLLIYGFAVPRSHFMARNLRGKVVLSSNLAADLKPRVFYTDLPGTVLYVEDIVQDNERRLKGILLARSDPNDPSGLNELFLASEGDLYPDPDGSGTLILDLYDGTSHVYESAAPELYRRVKFTFRQEPMELAAHLKGFLADPTKVVADLEPQELWNELQQARDERDALQAAPPGPGSGDPVVRLKLANHRVQTATIELHQRIALPMACFFFAVLAFPLGISRARSGKGAGFALSLLVILIYWAAFTLARNQASSGNIPAVLGTWAGNIVIVPWAMYAYWKLYRGTGSRSGLISRGIFFLLSLPPRIVGSIRRLAGGSPAATQGEEQPAEEALAGLGGTSARFLRRVDTYVLAVYLRICLLAIASAYLIFVLVEAKFLIDLALRNRQPLSLVLDYFVYFAPGVLPFVLPISCLVGAVVTFAVLTRSGELTAIKACGISMRRAVVPVLMLTAVLSILLFVVDDRISPITSRKAEEIKDQVRLRAPRSRGPAAGGRWSFGNEGNELYHFRLFDSDTQEFRALTVFTLDRSSLQILSHRFGDRARWRNETWEFENGWYRTFDETGHGDPLFEVNKGVEEVRLASPEEFTRRETSLTSLGDLPERLSSTELREQIEILEGSGYDTTRLKVDYHGKWARACSPFVMVLLGLPFAFKLGRRGSLYGIGVALLLVLVYWATLAIFNALGLETILDPFFAAWTPNILFGLFGAYLLLYVET